MTRQRGIEKLTLKVASEFCLSFTGALYQSSETLLSEIKNFLFLCYQQSLSLHRQLVSTVFCVALSERVSYV